MFPIPIPMPGLCIPPIGIPPIGIPPIGIPIPMCMFIIPIAIGIIPKGGLGPVGNPTGWV